MDLWIANLADGSTHEEKWLDGYFSPWNRLMQYCKKQNTYVTGLRLVMGEETMGCPDDAEGYWQAHGMPSVQGIEQDEELHKQRGIGWVVEDQVYILWAARDPATHQTAWWRDKRSSAGQGQIIWAHKVLVDPETLIRSKADVRGMKSFTKKIVSNAGGVKELYVPSHGHDH